MKRFAGHRFEYVTSAHDPAEPKTTLHRMRSPRGSRAQRFAVVMIALALIEGVPSETERKLRSCFIVVYQGRKTEYGRVDESHPHIGTSAMAEDRLTRTVCGTAGLLTWAGYHDEQRSDVFKARLESMQGRLATLNERLSGNAVVVAENKKAMDEIIASANSGQVVDGDVVKALRERLGAASAEADVLKREADSIVADQAKLSVDRAVSQKRKHDGDFWAMLLLAGVIVLYIRLAIPRAKSA
jgi:hypothetical protein